MPENLLIVTTVWALTGFADTSEEDGTAGATSNQITAAFLCRAEDPTLGDLTTAAGFRYRDNVQPRCELLRLRRCEDQ